MIPVARTENLLIQEVDDELMVYDQEGNTCHCLNPVAARVWHYCDGYNTVDDISKFLEEELEISADTDIRDLVWLALEELESFGLMKEYLREPIPIKMGLSRRKVLGKTGRLAGGLVAGALFPMVQSILAPQPAIAGCSGISSNSIFDNLIPRANAACPPPPKPPLPPLPPPLPPPTPPGSVGQVFVTGK